MDLTYTSPTIGSQILGHETFLLRLRACAAPIVNLSRSHLGKPLGGSAMISVGTRSEFTCMTGGLRMSNQSLKNVRLVVFIAASFLCVSAPSSAHHSQAV